MFSFYRNVWESVLSPQVIFRLNSRGFLICTSIKRSSNGPPTSTTSKLFYSPTHCSLSNFNMHFCPQPKTNHILRKRERSPQKHISYFQFCSSFCFKSITAHSSLRAGLICLYSVTLEYGPTNPTPTHNNFYLLNPKQHSPRKE